MSQQIVPCQCCGKPMEVIEQEWPHKPPTVFVTCKTPACPADGYTVALETYHERDMHTYGKKAG